MKRINSILLVDDNPLDNYVHRRVISKADCVDNLLSVQSAQAALDYLSMSGEKHENMPQLILLDLNMPEMDGWEFLEEYKKMDEALRGQMTVVILTTSNSPDDITRANRMMPQTLKDFQTKPLTQEALNDIMSRHFPA